MNKSLILILFLSLARLVSAQNISEVEFNTGYKMFKNGNFSPLISSNFETLGDSAFGFEFYLADSTVNRVKNRNYYIIDYNLNITDTLDIWQRNGGHVPFFFNGEQLIRSGIIMNSGKPETYRYYINSLNDTTSEIEVYTVKSTAQKDSLIFSKQFKFRSAFLTPLAINDKLVLISQRLSSTSSVCDTNYFESYNLSNNQLITSRMFCDVTPALDYITLANYTNPKRFLNSDSLFTIEGSPNLAKVYIFNHNSFNLHKIAGLTDSLDLVITNTYGLGFFFGRKYLIDSTGIEAFGETSSFGGSFTDSQFGVIKFNWNDSIVSIKQYGDTTKKESLFDYYKTKNTTYLLGNEPRPTSFFGKSPALIYKINDINNTYDSILIAGTNGYAQSENILIKKFGDIFITSIYANDFSSDSSINLVVTKIPAILLSTSEKFKNTRRLNIYPNPTRAILKSDEFQPNDLLRVYNVSGQLQFETQISLQKQISVEQLNSGTYILQIIRDHLQKAVIFVKE